MHKQTLAIEAKTIVVRNLEYVVLKTALYNHDEFKMPLATNKERM